MMKLKDIHTLNDANRYVEGVINDFETGISTQEETMTHLGNYTGRIMEIFYEGKESNLREQPKNPKLVEVIEAQDMVEYYAKKLEAAKIHLKKLKQE